MLHLSSLLTDSKTVTLIEDEKSTLPTFRGSGRFFDTLIRFGILAGEQSSMSRGGGGM